MSGLERIWLTFGLRGDLSDNLLIAALILVRITVIVFQTPFLGGRLVPSETRMGLSLGLTILVFPYAASDLEGQLAVNELSMLVLLLKEAFIGFVVGFLAAELFYFMEVAGRALDVMRGSNMAEVQVPELQLRVSPIGQFNFQLLLVVFCSLNGHGYFIESLIESFRVVPADGWPVFTLGMGHLLDQILQHTASLFRIAFALVFPGLFASFLVDVVFGMFNRIAPQLNAYFMAMGIKALSGLTLFMFAMSLMMGELAYQMEDTLLWVRRAVSFFQ